MFKFFFEYSVWEAHKQLDVRLQFGTQLKKNLAVVTVIMMDSKQVLNIQPSCLYLITVVNCRPTVATTMKTQKLSKQNQIKSKTHL